MPEGDSPEVRVPDHLLAASASRALGGGQMQRSVPLRQGPWGCVRLAEPPVEPLGQTLPPGG